MARFKPPTPEEVSKIKAALGLTGGMFAALLDLHGGQTVRKWQHGARTMDFCQLYTIVNRRTGRQITAENWRYEVQDLLQ